MTPRAVKHRRSPLALAAVTAFALAASLLVPQAPSAAAARPARDDVPLGFAATDGGTTGGAGAAADSVHVASSRAELITALDNGGRAQDPKIIYVRGDISGHEGPDGALLDDQDYAPGWDLGRYMDCFGPDGLEWSDDRYEWCEEQRHLRLDGSAAEKSQIQLAVPSNTTLLGVGDDARLLGVYLSVRASENIIIRNLHFEAPVDYFPSWDPWDWGGSWNARFDALSVVTGTHIWVDHCTFTDGRFPNDEAPEGFRGQPVERHDGLLDIEDGSDLVTVSYNRFTDHAKTMGLGSSDEDGELRITLHHNLFENSVERSPRASHAQVHSFNNHLTGSTDHAGYPMVSEELGGDDYFLGMGADSRMVSERNAFDYEGAGASADIVLSHRDGYRFLDTGSWFGGEPVDVNAIAERKFAAAAAAAIAEAQEQGTEPPEWALRDFTTDVGWDPADAYAYTPQRSPDAVRQTVLAEAGTGRLPITAP